MTVILLVLLAAYLMGSVAFAILMAKLYGLPDPRSHGSGNPGATNMLRTGKKSAAALTLIGDALKGYLAVLLAQVAAQVYGLPVYVPYLAALAAFLGHLFPVFHGFKGGKGVATALGVLLALDPRLGGLAVLTWLAVFALTRVSSLSALVAATLAPVYGYYLLGHGPETKYLAGILALLSLLVLARHHSNIRKLLSGEEKAFKKR
ncbi:MAG TPA: glycerol-3-phosphate 1-O-acyltransferase PlsY [Thiobacillaceae bacterium]|nr:glycerol-3-phosphate 1-O-acyltransferase PlsY [Thiobacillaceae bacterium]HNF89627.1 glycerol-3-phosphate 1-O-acyltransferase PlsY [Thiobacillaceae bacterium]HNH89605.1 glycerol-3-phosphate 1-O-acyltransferase PlsY [Thiobacillaceae bacterium]HNI06659.1 glycerol-3-phosphate 1-O-acyltransferase PlsY [Thiobacillaceae bacterium]